MTPFHLSSATLLALCFLLNSETTLNRVLQHNSSLNPWNIGVLCVLPWVTTVPKCITPGSRIGLMFLFPTGKAFYAELHHSRLSVSFCIVLRSHMLLFSLVFFCFPSCLSWRFLYYLSDSPKSCLQLLLSSCWLFNEDTSRKAVFQRSLINFLCKFYLDSP